MSRLPNPVNLQRYSRVEWLEGYCLTHIVSHMRTWAARASHKERLNVLLRGKRVQTGVGLPRRLETCT
jgi:hypothetical protein